MIRAVVFGALLVPGHALAGGLFLDIGLGHVQNGMAPDVAAAKALPSEPPADVARTRGPFGTIEVGYGIESRYGETSISALHLSSVSTGRDKGINFVGVTHRFRLEGMK